MLKVGWCRVKGCKSIFHRNEHDIDYHIGVFLTQVAEDGISMTPMSLREFWHTYSAKATGEKERHCRIAERYMRKWCEREDAPLYRKKTGNWYYISRI